jgi:Lrp/AsnC family leucine-responsive transcriptional regulator
MKDLDILDAISIKILTTLQQNARISFSELGRMVGLSSPAVAERVHRLETAGFIKQYSAVINSDSIGLSITAYITLKVKRAKLKDLDDLVVSTSEVVEAYHLAGMDDIMLKVMVSSVVHLKNIIGNLNSYGKTTTSIILSSPVSSRQMPVAW